MDLDKLSTSDKVIAGSGIALFVFSWLPWFRFDRFGRTFSQNGWDYFFTGIVPVLLGLAMVGWVVATKLAEVELPAIPVPEGLLLLSMGAAAAVLVLFRFLIGAGDNLDDVLSRSYGLMLSVLASAGLVGGGFLKVQESDNPGGPGRPSSGGPGTPF